jgi:hypothetical protein
MARFPRPGARRRDWEYPVYVDTVEKLEFCVDHNSEGRRQP